MRDPALWQSCALFPLSDYLQFNHVNHHWLYLLTCQDVLLTLT